jgi:hypothetical protein
MLDGRMGTLQLVEHVTYRYRCRWTFPSRLKTHKMVPVTNTDDTITAYFIAIPSNLHHLADGYTPINV